MSKNLINIKALTKDYKLGTTIVSALRGVDITVAENEFCILCGPSGSGKTTLLNIMGLIDKPTEGKLIIDGSDVIEFQRVEAADFRLNNIGFIFQKYYLMDELSAVENVYLPAIAKDGFSSKLASKASSILELVGLKDRLHHKPKHLSEGEKQRVAVARSLINEPKVLLCDEPTASLDSENGKVVLDLLAKINKESSATVFLVTHDERQLSYGDKIIRIADGKIDNKAWC